MPMKHSNRNISILLILLVFLSIPLLESEIGAQVSYGGVGVMIDYDPPGSGNVVIYSVTYKSPADRAKVKRGSRLLKVDGHEVTGKPLQEIAGLIRGPAGSSVTLSMLDTSGTVRDFALTRKSLQDAPPIALPPPSQIGKGTFLTKSEKTLVKQKILGLKTDAQRQRMLTLLTQLKEKKITKRNFLKVIKTEF